MKIAYSFWGFLADIKLDENYNEISTPDGNAFYSWSIIRELKKRNHDVIAIMPDRDVYSVNKFGKEAFSAWCTDKRYLAYCDLQKINYSDIDWKSATKEKLFAIWNDYDVDKCDAVLHEWRMTIKNRNDMSSRTEKNWQPDYFIQSCLIEYCKLNKIKMIVFDLDYKLCIGDIHDFMHIIELGKKWEMSVYPSTRVYIPFDFSSINYFDIVSSRRCSSDLVYIGNRYERDWCIDKYLPDKCTVYGNWKEACRDSEVRWPNIDFRNRIQLRDMRNAYSDAVCTILLAKEEYCRHSFMTARIIESIFYGSLPLFIEEYGEKTIQEFAGKYADKLTVKSREDVVDKINYFKTHEDARLMILCYLRAYLHKMDASFFVNTLEEIVRDLL